MNSVWKSRNAILLTRNTHMNNVGVWDSPIIEVGQQVYHSYIFYLVEIHKALVCMNAIISYNSEINFYIYYSFFFNFNFFFSNFKFIYHKNKLNLFHSSAVLCQTLNYILIGIAFRKQNFKSLHLTRTKLKRNTYIVNNGSCISLQD